MPPTDPRRLAADLRRLPTLPLGTEGRGPERRDETGAALAFGRTHEVCGPARATFAAMVAGALGRRDAGGPVLWLRAPAVEGGAAPDGLADFFAPQRLTLVSPRREPDVLWCAEEALRSGAVALVVASLAAPVRLTPVRRLHLAAESGAEAAAAAGGAPPLALLLTPGDGGSEGVESRWRLAPSPSAEHGWVRGGRPAWRLERRRARLAPPRAWRAEWAPDAARNGPLRLAPVEAAPEGAHKIRPGPKDELNTTTAVGLLSAAYSSVCISETY